MPAPPVDLIAAHHHLLRATGTSTVTPSSPVATPAHDPFLRPTIDSFHGRPLPPPGSSPSPDAEPPIPSKLLLVAVLPCCRQSPNHSHPLRHRSSLLRHRSFFLVRAIHIVTIFLVTGTHVVLLPTAPPELWPLPLPPVCRHPPPSTSLHHDLTEPTPISMTAVVSSIAVPLHPIIFPTTTGLPPHHCPPRLPPTIILFLPATASPAIHHGNLHHPTIAALSAHVGSLLHLLRLSPMAA